MNISISLELDLRERKARLFKARLDRAWGDIV